MHDERKTRAEVRAEIVAELEGAGIPVGTIHPDHDGEIAHEHSQFGLYVKPPGRTHSHYLVNSASDWREYAKSKDRE